MRCVALLLALLATFTTAMAQAQTWVQIEAHPDLSVAESRAAAYASVFTDVQGFQAASGWYLIVLGPYEPAAAAGRLADLRRNNMVPADSFISDGRVHRTAYWPRDGVQPLAPDVAIEETAIPDTGPDPLPETVVEPLPDVVPEPRVVDETPQQARASEGDLTRDDRMALQTALQWFGFYASGIDGAFGPGTRNSMADWQIANGYEPTGILTTIQRATLVANFQADQAEFGFQTIAEPEAGIEITLPMALLQFDHYEPPFVHFAEKDGSGLRVILISQPGDQATLFGLYDILQTLAVIPPDGARERGDRSFTINGTSATVQSYAYAESGKGQVKGYIAVWNPADAARMERILPTMQASFRGFGDTALDPGLVPMDGGTRSGLLAGLEVRKPKFSRSGFFVDPAGLVMTTAEAVAACGRITIDRDTDATVTLTDAAGVAVLTPVTPLAPRAYARLAASPRIGSNIAVSGYSFEDTLPAPVLTQGSLEDLAGLKGETGVARISAPVLAGDAGGPVLDAAGAVIGMLLPAEDGARQLPDGVAFAATDLARVASAAGVSLGSAPAEASPDAQSRAAQGMTVLVSCWE